MITIKHRICQVGFFDNQDTDGVDQAASLSRYAALVADQLQSWYPEASITVRPNYPGQFGDHTQITMGDTWFGATEESIGESILAAQNLVFRTGRWPVLTDGTLLRA